MILEVADIRIPPGKNAEFEAAIGQGLATVVPRATGIATLIVDRNARAVLAHTDDAVVLEKGRVVLAGESQQLAEDGAALERYLGV